MGAATFLDYYQGTDVNEVFGNAVEDARYEYGHRGYTGTIAEKYSVIVVRSAPMPYDDAIELAGNLFDDPRVLDKRGPAGAIAVRGGTVTREIEITTEQPLDTRAQQDEFAAALAAERFPGETVTETWWPLIRRTGGTSTGVLHLHTTGAPEHTGWILFGWAPC